MHVHAVFAALRTRLLGSHTLAIAASASQTPSYGLAKRAYPLPRDVGPQQLPALRLALLTEAKRAKHLRQSKLEAQCRADLKVVTHQMMDLHNRGR